MPDLYTVYELFKLNSFEFPFWIKPYGNPSTCLLVTGWSKVLGAKTYQGVPILKIASVVRDEAEIHSSSQEDFKETGQFVGVRHYLDKRTPVDPHSEKLLAVSAGSTKSWLPA